MTRSIGVTILLAAVAAVPLAAQQPDPTPPASDVPNVREGRFGAGVQLTWPTYGVSGMLDVTDRLSIQAVLGSAGWGLAATGRGLFRFQPNEWFTPYAYGEAGIWTGYSHWGTIPNFGAGGGAEMDIRKLVPEAPPVYVAFEAGLNMAVYRDAFWGNGTLTRFQAGPALHYRF